MAVTADANGIYCDNGTYSFADIYAAAGIGGVDFLRVDSGTGYRTYRSLKTIFIGQTVSTGTGTTNATTFTDTDCTVTFDTGKFFRTRTGTTSTIAVNLGTKVGTGSVATGGNGVVMLFANAMTMSIRGTVKMYGCVMKNLGTGNRIIQISPASAGNASELINCILDGWSGIVFGSSGGNIPIIYNVDIIAGASATNLITSFFIDAAELMTIGGAVSGQFITSGSAGLSFKDTKFFGSAGTAHLNSTGSSPNWKIVRPTFISGTLKFFTAGASGGADNGCHEYWRYDAKCVDGAGAGVSGIPVRLTDTLGNVQVDTTTDSAGELSFGSGLTENMVITCDHYTDGSYTIRQRGPFLAEVNMPTQTGYNSAYRSHRVYFDCPGSETVTTTAGSFEDMNDIFQMAPIPGANTQWEECSL